MQINGKDELQIDMKARLVVEYVETIDLFIDLRCFFGSVISLVKSDGVVEVGTGLLETKKGSNSQ